MPEIILHLGLHKTGTTSLQYLYKVLSDDGGRALYIHPDHHAYQPFRRLLIANRTRDIDKHDAKSEADNFLAACQNYDTVYISDENILGPAPFAHSQSTPQGLYPRLEQQVRLLEFVFNAESISFITTWRPVAELLYSFYRDGLKYGRYAYTFMEYLQHLEIPSFTHEHFLRRLRAVTDRSWSIKSITSVMTAHDFQRIGLIDQSIPPCQLPKLPRLNNGSSRAKATIQRLFYSYSDQEINSLKKWLSECPVKLKDHNISYMDVGLSEDALHYIDINTK